MMGKVAMPQKKMMKQQIVMQKADMDSAFLGFALGIPVVLSTTTTTVVSASTSVSWLNIVGCLTETMTKMVLVKMYFNFKIHKESFFDSLLEFLFFTNNYNIRKEQIFDSNQFKSIQINIPLTTSLLLTVVLLTV